MLYAGFCQKGDLPVQAEVRKEQMEPIQRMLLEEGLLPSKCDWQQGRASLSHPYIQCQMGKYTSWTPRLIRDRMGLTWDIQDRIERVVSAVRPDVNVPEFAQRIHEMLCPRAASKMVGPRPLFPLDTHTQAPGHP